MYKKVGLLSFISSCNYGTLLQDYALVRKIKDLGCAAEYIDYHATVESSGVRKFLGDIKRKLVRKFGQKNKKGIDDFSFWHNKSFKSIETLCQSFIDEYIPISIKYDPRNIDTCSNVYERFIVGSDQTWSPHIIKENSPFLLGFVNDDKKKFAYAPSMGTLNIPTDFQLLLKEKLVSFQILSCREHHNCKTLSKILGKEVFHVLDPTLLLTKEEWLSIATPVCKMPKKYILCYILGEKKCISDFADKLGLNVNVPVYYIYTRPFYSDKQNLLTNVGPREFLTLVAGCSCLVTDSFHGSIFSINFEVPFFTFTKREAGFNSQDNDRIKEILGEFKLLSRYCDDDAIADEILPIDYSEISPYLYKMRKESINILISELK